MNNTKIEKLNGGQMLFLDVFRILATLFVVVGHSFSWYQISIFINQTYFPWLQNIAVVMFFLLSGFLTVYSLETKCQTNNDYSFTKYFRHKFTRFYIEYVPALILIVAIDFIAIKINSAKYGYYDAYNIKQFVGNLLMLQGMALNYFKKLSIVPFGSARQLWTLSVEWWLYLLFGLVFIIIRKNKKINIINSILILFFVFMPAHLLIGGRGSGLGFVFFLGAFGYYIYDLIDERICLFLSIASIILYIVYGCIFKEAYTVHSFILLLCIFVTFLKTSKVYGGGYKRSISIKFLSQSTFMLYLLHYSIIDLIFNSSLAINIYLKFFIGVFVSIIISLMMYWIFGYNKYLRNGFIKICGGHYENC